MGRCEGRGRYRNRVEFKAMSDKINEFAVNVDIETEWNLKSSGCTPPYHGLSRYRNRVEFKVRISDHPGKKYLSRYRNRVEFKVVPSGYLNCLMTS